MFQFQVNYQVDSVLSTILKLLSLPTNTYYKQCISYAQAFEKFLLVESSKFISIMKKDITNYNRIVNTVNVLPKGTL